MKKVVSGHPDPTVNKTLYYLGGVEYDIKRTLPSVEFNEKTLNGDGFIAKFNTETDPTAFSYFIQDHLGNTVVVFTEGEANVITQGEPVVLQRDHYYPFGMPMKGPWKLDESQSQDQADFTEYRYNGKEFNKGAGADWYDYGARWYDASIGRWNGVDPLADAAPGWTPYRYGFNNPVYYTDPTGMIEEPPVNGLPYFGDDTGDYYWNEVAGSYDHHDKETGDYIGQFKLDIDETYEPVGDYRISFFNYTGDESAENNQYDISKTPLAAASYMLYLSGQGDLKSLSDESKYLGVKIYSSPHTEGGVTLGNVIFVNEGYYNESQL